MYSLIFIALFVLCAFFKIKFCGYLFLAAATAVGIIYIFKVTEAWRK